MKQLPIDKLSLLSACRSAELRFTNDDGETEAWIVTGPRVSWMMKGIDPKRDVRFAYIDNGTDTRISRQLESINRLLSHVKHHCPEFNNNGECTFIWEGDKDAIK